MMSRNKISILFPFLSLLLFLALSFLRCADADRNPMRPGGGEGEQLELTASDGLAFDGDMILKTRSDETLDRSDVKIITRNKDDGEGDELWVMIPDPSVFLFDFGPEGKKFKRPVKIQVSLSKADLSDLYSGKIKVWYLSGDRPKIVPSKVDRKNEKLYFWVKHFSRYALSRE